MLIREERQKGQNPAHVVSQRLCCLQMRKQYYDEMDKTPFSLTRYFTFCGLPIRP